MTLPLAPPSGPISNEPATNFSGSDISDYLHPTTVSNEFLRVETTVQGNTAHVNEDKNETDVHISGMALNPHWIANGGVKPIQWRNYTALLKSHATEMQCFQFDVASGGKVKCLTFCAFPESADISAKLCKDEGYFGQKSTGYKWEFFKAHLLTREHQQCVTNSQKKCFQPKLNKVISDINAYTEKGKIGQLKRLVNTIHYMVKRNIPIDQLEDLAMLQKANGCDMSDQYLNDCGFQELLNSLDSITMEDVKKKIEHRRFVGGKGDGTTDKGMLSQEAGQCRVVDFETGFPEELFMGLEELDEEDADAVYSALKRMCQKVGITEEKFQASVTNFNMDGASVNLGCNDSVKTRLIDNVSHMIIVHCVNHSFELVVSVAAKGHSKVEDSISTLEEVFKFYHYSPKKLRHLNRTAEIFEQILDHFGGLKQIRWCASQHRAWVAMFDNYEMVVDHLGQMQNDMSSFKKEDRDRAGALLLRVTNIQFVMMMNLMNDLLADVGKVSVKMQNPKAIILDVPDWKETLLTAVFNARSCLTPHLSAFVNQFDTSTFKWRNILLMLGLMLANEHHLSKLSNAKS